MRFVKGESLKEAIARFHQKDAVGSRKTHRRNLRLRELLNRFVAVCNVIAYTHSRGVIHRDLKPSNILLGFYGETLVVDWGLAKPIGRKDPNVTLAAGDATLQPAAMSGTSETIAGTAIGTPAFMSPEQAAGRIEQVGPLSDVYSLGATLYALLIGQPAVNDPDVATVLHKVRHGDYPPPRQIDPKVPRSLEAICLKAMALDPKERLRLTSLLAGDLERWLADEPVAVYREPISTRITRWGRRHGKAAVGLGALLVTTAIALAVSTALIGYEQARTEQQRLLALQNFREAKNQHDLAAARSRELSEKAETLERQLYVNRINLAQRDHQTDVVLLNSSSTSVPPPCAAGSGTISSGSVTWIFRPFGTMRRASTPSPSAPTGRSWSRETASPTSWRNHRIPAS